MGKPTKATEQPKNEQPQLDAAKAVEAIKAIADIVLRFRAIERPALAQVATIADRASNMLGLGEEKSTIAHSATIEIAKARRLLG